MKLSMPGYIQKLRRRKSYGSFFLVTRLGAVFVSVKESGLAVSQIVFPFMKDPNLLKVKRNLEIGKEI
jgi:hypothetical protein